MTNMPISAIPEHNASGIEPNRSYTTHRTLRGYISVSGRGFLMGCADVVPGISGGTIAFILGIYYELIESIRAFVSVEFWRNVINLSFKDAARSVNLGFLIALLMGIGVAVLTLARGVEWVLENRPIYLWSFFFGLIGASAYTIARRIPYWNLLIVLIPLVGAVGAFFLVGIVPIETTNANWFIFLSGAIAICALVVPGISGSFLLILLGKYQYILNALNERDLFTLIYFAAGGVIGVLLFSQLLSRVIRRYYVPTTAFFLGFVIGSMRKIWPWQDEGNYTLPPLEADTVLLIGLMLLGAVSILSLDLLYSRLGGKHNYNPDSIRL